MWSEAVVHVVDDDTAVRESLSFLLASDGLPVRLHESASAFLETVVDTAVGCIVTDVRMPGIDGIEFLRRLRAQGHEIPVVVMTGHADLALAVEALREGAVDFIEKPFDDDLFLGVVRSALQLHEQHAHRDAQAQEVQVLLDGLSGRERQVLEGLVAGKTNQAISDEIGTDPRAVEICRANVMTRMQAGSLSELVRLALLAGVGPGPAAPDP